MALLNLTISVILLTLTFTSNATGFSIRSKYPSEATWLESVRLEVASKDFDVSSDVNLTFTFHGHSERIKLQLVPNDDIFSSLESIQYLAPDGSVSSSRPFKRSQHFIYKGDASVYDPVDNSWKVVGISRITIRSRGNYPLFEGTFTLDGNRFNVEIDATVSRALLPRGGLAHNSGRRFMVVWREGDGRTSTGELKRDTRDELRCGLDIFEQTIMEHLAVRKYCPRDNRFLGSEAGCPSTTFLAIMSIVTDCSYTAKFGSLDDLRSHIFTKINAVSQLYEDTFNISLSIRNLSISDGTCTSIDSSSTQWNLPCSVNVDTTTRLSRFSQWRGKFEYSNALWALMSGCGKDATVRSPWLSKACRQGSADFYIGRMLQDVFVYR